MTRLLIAVLSGLLVATPPEPRPDPETLDRELRELVTAGRYADAEELARARLEELDAAGALTAEVETVLLESLVIALRRQGRSGKAETLELARRAVTVDEALHGADHPEVADSLRNLAVVLRQSGRLDEARPHLERALAIQEAALGPDHGKLGSTLNSYGILLMSAGDYETARDVYERAVRIKAAVLGREHPSTATSLANLGAVLEKLGYYGEAREIRAESHAILEAALGPEHPSVAIGMLDIGRGYYFAGDFTAARDWFERTIEAVERVSGPDHPRLAEALDALAILFRATGNYADGLAIFERTLALRERAYGPEHPSVAQSLNNMANLTRDLGRFAEARPLYERSLAMREGTLGPDHPRTALALMNLAISFLDTDAIEQARPLLERARRIQEEALGPDHPDLARTLEHLAIIAEADGDPVVAETLYRRARDIVTGALGASHPDAARFEGILARARLRLRRYDEAFDGALEAERAARAHLRLTSRTLAEREALRYAAVRPRGLDVAISVAVERSAPGRVATLWSEVIRSRAAVFDEMAARQRAVGAADAETGRLADDLRRARARLARLVVRGPEPGRPDRFRVTVDEALREKERAERALAARSLAFRDELNVRDADLAAVTGALGKGTALVAFVRYNHLAPDSEAAPGNQAPPLRATPSYVAFVRPARAGPPTLVRVGTGESIEWMVDAWRQEATRKPPAARAARRRAEMRYREAAGTLASVWASVVSSSGSPRRIVVVLDGALNLVNPATFPDDDGGYLVESDPVVRVVSAERDLVPMAGRPAAGRGLLALGAPDFDAAPSRPGAGEPEGSALRGAGPGCEAFLERRFPPLAGSRREAEDVARLWDAARGDGPDVEPVVLTGSGAGEDALRRAAPGRRVLHLATHGFFLDDRCAATGNGARGAAARAAVAGNPLLLSGLAVAGANTRQAAGPGGSDGILTAEEIASLDLRGVESVVLSACDTGLGEILPGEGVLGLRRAFRLAGARDLVMTLWSVQDESTRQWMERLYRARLEGLDTTGSVRRAHRDVLADRRARKLSDHPFFWGAFIATGGD